MGVEVVENGGKDKPEMSQVIRHYCKVCNRGFNCAGALGGHMRAHVIGDVSHHNNNVNHPSHGDEHLRGSSNNNKHSYFLRAKTTRFMGYHEASNDEDGEFKKPSSSFGRFGGVEKERVLPMLSSQGSKSEHFDHEYSASSEEEDLANCLVMLSNKSYALSSDHRDENKAKEVAEKGLFQCKACKKVFNSHQALGGHRASHKKVKGCFAAKSDGLNEDESNNNNNNNNVDEDSIQEDHDSFTQTESDATGRPMSTISSSTRKRPKMHECSVCRRVFSSGQALGGHKRCHWLTTSTDNAFIPNFQDFQYDHQSQQLYKKPMLTKPHHDHHDQDQDQDHDHDHDHQLDLNLNLPAPGNSDHHNNTSRFEASTRLYLKQLAASANHSCQSKIESTVAVEKGDKLRKLSDLRDVSMDGGWLQMGIASTTDIY